ncbi:unnamed protein product [Leptosia nina]|uniref:Uncharacterized protein n=1 Tax=Leptosia nina TaxID=320188 RepID=A0AAV1K0I0_9NEOP
MKIGTAFSAKIFDERHRIDRTSLANDRTVPMSRAALATVRWGRREINREPAEPSRTAVSNEPYTSSHALLE